MSRYKINKIRIQNFKIFSDPFEQEFKNSDLVVFDGPNGFGKTSVFDAIELALTGMIKRLDIYDETVKNKKKAYSFPFINNDQNDFYIQLELISSSGSLVVCRYLKRESISKKEVGKLSWEKIKIGKLNSWADDYNNATDLTQDSLEGLLGIKDLKRIFNIFFYVQQEENTFFLKRSEAERKEYLNILFDVDKESRFVEKLKKAIKLQKEFDEEKKSEVKKLEEKKIKPEALDDSVQLVYERLFPQSDIEWDKENPDFKKLNYNNLLEGFSDIEKLQKSLIVFKSQKEALKVKSYLSSSDFIKSYLLFKNYQSTFSKIIEKYEEGKELKSILESIEKKYLDVDFWRSKKDFLEQRSKINFQTLIDSVSSYLKLQSSYNSLEKIKTELNNFRKSFSETYKKFIALDNQNQEDCPLCGNTWPDIASLAVAISDTEKRFMSSSQTLIQGTHDQIIKIKDQLKVEISKILSESYHPDEGLISVLRVSNNRAVNYEEVDKFIQTHSFNYIYLQKLISIEDLKNIEAETNNFTKLFEEKISKMITLGDVEFARQEAIFLKYFAESYDLVTKFDVSKIPSKVNFIRSKYIEHSATQNQELDKKIQDLHEEMTAVTGKIDKIKSIQKIYEEKIKAHIARIINDISIPFYINSGRILQEFHGGNGIFVKMGDLKTDGVKFYSDIDAESDPLYSLSSGQISSLVLAFCLTLNDVYRDHALGMILIDDPIQTMDEINTITFIDLIRNNFRDRQFIISTHEDSFSALVRYKFKQNNASVSAISMKEAL